MAFLKPMRAASRCFWLGGLLLFMVPPALLLQAMGRKKQGYVLAQNFFRWLLWGLEIHTEQKGTLANTDGKPLLLVANHISWLDVLVMARYAPVIFTPKREIARWPLVGSLTKLAGAVFVDRKARHVQDNLQEMRPAMASGRPLLLFAEGTTGDGRTLLPFKSSFFALATEEDVSVQPAVLRYQVPGEDAKQPSPVAWYGEMEFLPHFWKVLQIPRLGASLELLPPLDIPPGERDRKALANLTRTHMVRAIEAA